MLDYGAMQVRVFRASEALPIQNASVKITGSDEYNGDIQISLLTDNDGVTPTVNLPAPPPELSRSPGAKSQPYSTFDVEIVKAGYYPKKIISIPIFAGIKAVLPIEMIPLSYSETGDVIRLENLNSVIFENEML